MNNFLDQVVIGGVFGVVTAFIAYRQAISTATKQAAATVEVKRLEVGSASEARLNEQLTRCQSEVQELNRQLREAYKAQSEAEAQHRFDLQRLDEAVKDLEQVTTERDRWQEIAGNPNIKFMRTAEERRKNADQE